MSRTDDCAHARIAIGPSYAGAQCDGEVLAKCLVCGEEFGVVPTLAGRGDWEVEWPDNSTANSLRRARRDARADALAEAIRGLAPFADIGPEEPDPDDV